MVRRLYTLREIIMGLKYDLNLVENKDFYLVSTKEFDLTNTPKRRNRDKDRSVWCDSLAKVYFGVNRENIVKTKPRINSTGEYNLVYIKLAVSKGLKNRTSIEKLINTYGVVHGKTSFHCMYPGDVWFYEFDDDSKKELRELFEDKGLEWYTDYIIVIKPKNPLNAKEAYELEDKIKLKFNTFD